MTEPFKRTSYGQRALEYSKFDKYLDEKRKQDRLGNNAQIRDDIAKVTLNALRENPDAEGLTFFSTNDGTLIGARNNAASPNLRSFYIADMDDDNKVSLAPLFSLPEASFANPLSSLDSDWVDKKTLASFSPLYNMLDPALVESVRGMYDEADGKYTPKTIYKRAMEAPVWDLASIVSVPGRETAPQIGRMPAATRVRWRTKSEAPADISVEPAAVPVKEEVEEEVKTEDPVKTAPTTKSASDLFTEMRSIRKSRKELVKDDTGNVDVIKSSTSSLFRSRMRGSRV